MGRITKDDRYLIIGLQKKTVEVQTPNKRVSEHKTSIRHSLSTNVTVNATGH